MLYLVGLRGLQSLSKRVETPCSSDESEPSQAEPSPELWLESARLVTFSLQLEKKIQLENQKIVIFCHSDFLPYFPSEDLALCSLYFQEFFEVNIFSF